ncbi:MAG: glycosyltransferase family 9 protein [Anaerolineae bacterium]
MTARHRVRLVLLRALGALLPASHPPLPPHPRLLVLRPDHIGDLLWMLPALAELCRCLPAAHITLAVGPWVESFARLVTGVDSVEVVAFPGFERNGKGGSVAPYRLSVQLARRWRGRYDACLVARADHWWGAMTAALAGVPHRIGRCTPETAPFLTGALPLGPHQHEVVANVALARFAAGLLGGGTRSLGPCGRATAATDERPQGARLPEACPGGPPGETAPTGACPPDSPVTPETHPIPLPLPAEARERTAAWARRNLGRDEGYVCVHPGAGGPTKLWPVARYEALVRALAADGRPVVVTGSLAEADLVARVATAATAPSAAPVAGAAGEFGLLELTALLARAALVVGSDSGPLHIAAAVGAPTVHVYGPADEVKFGPWSPASRHRVLTAAVPCRPCGDLAHCAARDHVGCMRRVPLETVLAACRELLAADGAAPL